jgi:AraC-like DNA-binding protein/ligand-binding sensor protein
MDFYAASGEAISMERKADGKLEILLNEHAQAALDNFSACFGVRIAYFRPDQTELQVGLKKSRCGYCAHLQDKLYGSGRCLQNDRKKLAEALRQRTLIHYTCHGGLVEAICPVILQQTLIGYVMVGQFRTGDVLPAHLRREARLKGGSVLQLRKAYQAVPKVPPEKVPAMLGLFSLLVKAIVSEGIAAVHGDLMVERILHEIRSHPEHPPTLAQAARWVGRSHSAVSHLFKAKLGRSFKSCVVDIRMDRAEELLRHEPGVTVKEVAARLGFMDEFYFSRIFRQRKGLPPSQCLVRQ